MTVWMALVFLVFLSLYLVCVQSVKKQFQRQQAEQAVEAGVFSLFSEFEPHLLEKYDLFYLDTSFRSGTEQLDEVRSHLWKFLKDNLTDSAGMPLAGLELRGVNVDGMVRATDDRGAVFWGQAVRVMKEKTGFSLAEDWILEETVREGMEDEVRKYQEDYEEYRNCVRDYADEEDEVEAEAYEWDGLQESFVCSMAVPGNYTVSEKKADLNLVPSVRELSAGAGKAAGNEEQILQKQWFISYLCEYLTDAGQMLPSPRQEGYLDYQLEYVLCGKASDRENLEAVIEWLLLIREGVNYTFLLGHPSFTRKADLLAKVLVGLTGNTALMEGVKHLILLGWAYGESLVEVRQLLEGFELSAVKTETEWQVPLSGLLTLTGDPGKYDGQEQRQEGIGYAAYLRLLLSLHSSDTLAMRGLDIIEGELRSTEGCEMIHLDHCVEAMNVQVWLPGISLEREYGYE